MDNYFHVKLNFNRSKKRESSTTAEKNVMKFCKIANFGCEIDK